MSQELGPEARRALLADAGKHGDAARGAQIFQREALGCVRCHTVEGTGGQLGPDLTSVGAYMTPESLLESLLNPSTSIKQGYETVVVARKSGTLLSGTLQRRTDTGILLRDASGEIIAVADDDIAGIDTSPVSLMPRELTASLRQDELLDLLRFLMSLGKKKS